MTKLFDQLADTAKAKYKYPVDVPFFYLIVLLLKNIFFNFNLHFNLKQIAMLYSIIV